MRQGVFYLIRATFDIDLEEHYLVKTNCIALCVTKNWVSKPFRTPLLNCKFAWVYFRRSGYFLLCARNHSIYVWVYAFDEIRWQAVVNSYLQKMSLSMTLWLLVSSIRWRTMFLDVHVIEGWICKNCVICPCEAKSLFCNCKLLIVVDCNWL